MRISVYIAAIAALCTGSVKLALVATQSESGWSTITTQWQDAFFGWMGLGHTPIGDREPIEQATFWLAEVKRLGIEDSKSAPDLMGAAWVLDSPSITYMHKHLQQKQIPGTSQYYTVPDEEAIGLASRQFHDLCQPKCLELAKLATEIEPNDVRWWRMRALLLFEGDIFFSGLEFQPREDNWLQVLDECIVHDPDNALYDYLAAMQLWTESSTVDWPDDPSWPVDQSKLTTEDEGNFEEGTKRFLAAQEKPFIAIGEAGFPAVAEFLENCDLRKAEMAETAVGRLLTIRQSFLFHKLWRLLEARADNATQRSDLVRQGEILRQCLRLYDQATISPETSALQTTQSYGRLRQSAFDDLLELSNQNPTLLDAQGLDAIRKREIVHRTSSATLLISMGRVQSTQTLRGNILTLASITSGVASVSVAALLWAAIAATVLAAFLRWNSGATPPFGFWRHGLAWLIGYGSTFVVLGLAPAEVIRHETQTKAIIAAVWIGAIAITAAMVWWIVNLLRRRKLRFRLITLFAVTTAVAVLSALLPVVTSAVPWLKQRPTELWLHAKGWSGIDPEVLRNGVGVAVGSWQWAIVQWLVHAGLLVGLAIALLLAVAWYARRIARQSGEGMLNYWTRDVRSRWATLLRFTARAATAAAICWLLVYLFATPELIRSTETLYQYQMRYCREPQSHWNEIIEAQKQVESSPQEMRQIRSQVESSMSQETEPDSKGEAE